MNTCTIEVGLLRKHPCGLPSVAKCANCEQPLCAKHAVPQMSGGKKVFLCAECAEAWTKSEKDEKSAAATKAARDLMSGSGQKPAPRPSSPPPAAAPKPAPQPPAQKNPQPGEPAPAKKPGLSIEDSAPLEFTPEPKKPADKK